MPETLKIERFIELMDKIPLVDVRSPGEYEAGHIPQAINIPVFDNKERAQVGIRYKNSGKDFAYKLGREIAEPKIPCFKELAAQTAKDDRLLFHCWRGGMRSQEMAKLFESFGIKTYLLEGGYNAYRRYIRKQFSQCDKLMILGGFTGSGKTDILKALAKKGEQIIDLEGIAHHKGSAFGNIGQEPQPTNEQFENNLAQEWHRLNKTKRIWLEDESITLGNNGIPVTLWENMRQSPVIKVNIPLEVRAERLIKEYACLDQDQLMNSLKRIGKRLGFNNQKTAMIALQEGNHKLVAEITLKYYDKAYLKGLSKRDPKTITVIDIDDDNPDRTGEKILKSIHSEE
jgi:tRNA 2-selenouridine synthase